MEPCENPLGALYAGNTPGARALERIRRHHEAATRAWFRATRDLDRLRRHAFDNLLFGAQLPTTEPEVADSTGPVPQIGFVPKVPAPAPSLAEIAARSSAADPRLALRL